MAENTDLLRRYCPHLTQHNPETVAQYIPEDTTQCWEWTRYIDTYGYGIVYTVPEPSGYYRSLHVHRYLYDLLVGPVEPDDATPRDVHHRCGNRACWSPFHLELVTPKEHKARHHLENG
jgi:HNH endonuclease